jgi:hypothetical protein
LFSGRKNARGGFSEGSGYRPGPADLADRFFPDAQRSAPARGGNIMHAATV